MSDCEHEFPLKDCNEIFWYCKKCTEVFNDSELIQYLSATVGELIVKNKALTKQLAAKDE